MKWEQKKRHQTRRHILSESLQQVITSLAEMMRVCFWGDIIRQLMHNSPLTYDSVQRRRFNGLQLEVNIKAISTLHIAPAEVHVLKIHSIFSKC